MHNPLNLPTFIVSDTEIPTQKIIEKIENESKTFQKVISDFDTEEKKYWERRSVSKKNLSCKYALKML